MAEAFLKALCGEEFECHSAGIEPGKLNPLAVEVMREVGIDISKNQTKGVLDFIQSERRFAYVITVCDETSAERCPVFPGVTARLHWGFPDPSSFEGTWDERLEQTRKVRDRIKAKVEEWFESVCPFIRA